MSINREKIKLIPGVPLTVTLDDVNGKPMTSRFHDGTEYLYSVTERGAACLLYLPVEGAQAISRSGAQSGDVVQILKTHLQGQAPQFTVRVFSDAHNAALPAPPATQGGVRMLAPRSQTAPQVAPQAVPPPPPAQQYGPVTGHAVANGAQTVHRLEEIMQRCFVVAGRALWHAHADLVACGCAYDAPTIEDARAAGISMFIERTRNMGGR